MPTTQGYGYIELWINWILVQLKSKKNLENLIMQPQESLFKVEIILNAGIFVWSKTVLKAYEEFQPVMYDHFMNGYEALNTL